jgi:hypothetical protein
MCIDHLLLTAHNDTRARCDASSQVGRTVITPSVPSTGKSGSSAGGGSGSEDSQRSDEGKPSPRDDISPTSTAVDLGKVGWLSINTGAAYHDCALS